MIRTGSGLARGLTRAITALFLLTSLARAEPGAMPPTPYYSLQIASVNAEAVAMQKLRDLHDAPAARVEIRGDAYAVRFGAWASRDEAEQALTRYRDSGGAAEAFVLRIQNAVPWMLPVAEALATATESQAAPDADLPGAAGAIVRSEPHDIVSSEPHHRRNRATTEPATASAQEPQTAAPDIGQWWKTAQVRIEDLGWNNGFVLDGPTGSRDLYLPVPKGIEARAARLALDVQFGDSLIGESTLLLSVNDAPRRTLRRATAGPAGATHVDLPLTARDLGGDFVHVRFDYTQLADRDVCFSEALAGAWSRIEPGSGLVVQTADQPPSTVRAAWALLPRDVTIAADFSSLDADSFQALFRLASMLRASGREFHLRPLPVAARFEDVPAHIVLAAPGAGGVAAVHTTRSPYVDRSGGGARLVIERASPAIAADVLSRPWRSTSAAALTDHVGGSTAPTHAKGRDSLHLSDLGFAESERRFQRSTRWDIPLPFGAMGPAMRPDWAQLQIYAPDSTGKGNPIVLSAYYNDRLVYSGTLAGGNHEQSVDFALPRHLLRARNQLSLVAQRDQGPERCGSVASTQAISVSPSSRILLKPFTDMPQTFAELVPYESSLKVYLPEAALSAAQHVIPFLVGAGAQFWPSASPPEIRFYAADQPFKPDGPFLVLGQPRWEVQSPIQFDQGRVRLLTAAGGAEFAMLEMTPAAEWAVLQMAQAAGHAGVWALTPQGGFANLPAHGLEFEDEDVAVLNRGGVDMALRVGPTRDYEVSYPDSQSWFDAAGHMRVLLFIVAWLLVASVIVYLLRASRRHRGPRTP